MTTEKNSSAAAVQPQEANATLPKVEKIEAYSGNAPTQTKRTLCKKIKQFAFQKPWLAAAFISIVCVGFYWGVIASDRYVSETHLIVDRTDIQAGSSFDLASMITGGGYSGVDLRLLRDHLRSVDMLNKLEEKLQLRQHFSSDTHDIFSRLSKDASQEDFHAYYLARTSIEIDDQVGVLRIKAQAYTPLLAQEIAQALIAEGEAFMNEMGHALARTQVHFLEQQVAQSSERQQQARNALLAFQNETGLISPQAQAQALAEITARLEGELTTLRAQRSAMLGYLSPQAADVVQLGLKISALEKQLQKERARLAAPIKGKSEALNRQVEQYQQLEMETKFTQQVYETSMMALERGRIEALRMLKKISVLQQPTLAQDSTEPKRLYNTLVFALTVLALAIIGQLLAAIIRDHRD